MTLSTYKEEFQKLPGEITEAFSEAWGALVEVLTEEELVTWADNGLSIAQRPGRSWEAAIEYFKASPFMVQHLPFIHLKQWGYWGNEIAEESPIVSRIYFKTSPQIAKSLKPWDVAEWAQLGKKLYGKGNRSGVLSIR